MTTDLVPTGEPRRRIRLGAVAAAVVAIMALGPGAPPAGAADPTTPEEWVALIYRTCLHREPDPAGLDHWMELYGDPDVQGGARLIAFPVCLSSESHAPTIVDAFDWLLDREPSAADLAYWTPYVRGRRNLRVVERHVLASAERYATSGGTDAAYVEDLYQRVLDRPATSADAAYWVGRLGSGEHRLRTIDALLGTPEAHRARVVRLALATVGRPPSQDELYEATYMLRTFHDPRLADIVFVERVVLVVP